MFGLGASATQAFMAQVQAKTGLVGQGDRFVGTFYGLPAWSRTQMVADVAGNVMGHGGVLGGLGALMGGGMGGMAVGMSGGAFFMKHEYVIQLPTSQLPGASLRETTSFLADKSWQQRQAMGQRMSSGVPWIDQRYEVCGQDPNFLHFVCSSLELQQHLPRWPYLNLSWYGQEVWLELLDSSARIASKFGAAAMQNGDMVLQGLSLVFAAARATFPR